MATYSHRARQAAFIVAAGVVVGVGFLATTGSGYIAGPGLPVGCSPGERPEWDGSAWQCKGSVLTQEQTYSTTGSSDDIALTSSTTNVFAYTGASDATFTGWTGGTAGRFVFFQNRSTTASVKFAHDVTSTAANRFYASGSADLVCGPRSRAIVTYVAGTTNRWLVMGGTGCYSQASNTLLGDRPGVWTSSRYYYIPSTTITGTSSLSSNGTMRCAPKRIPSAVTITKIGVEVVTGGEAGSKVRLCVYGDDGTAQPGSLVLDAGQVDGVTVGLPEATVSMSAGPGVYWFCTAAQSAPTTQPTLRIAGSGTNYDVDMQIGAAPSTDQRVHGYSMSGVTAACPSTFSASGVTGVAARMFVKT